MEALGVATLIAISAPAVCNVPIVRQLQSPSSHNHASQIVNRAAAWTAHPAVYPVRPDAPVLDFGEIPTTKSAKAKVRLTNHDTREHILVRVQGKGPVTVIMPANITIAPGNTIELDCQLAAPPKAGPIVGKTVSIVCEGQPTIAIPIRAQAVSYVEVEPNVIDLECDVNPLICLRSIDGERFRVLESSPDCIDQVSRESRSDHSLLIRTDALRSASPARMVMLKLDHPQCESVRLAVRTVEFDTAEAALRLP